MKILVVCGHGLGTSLMMEMSIKSILKELAVTAETTLIHFDYRTRQSLPLSDAHREGLRAWLVES